MPLCTLVMELNGEALAAPRVGENEAAPRAEPGLPGLPLSVVAGGDAAAAGEGAFGDPPAAYGASDTRPAPDEDEANTAARPGATPLPEEKEEKREVAGAGAPVGVGVALAAGPRGGKLLGAHKGSTERRETRHRST